MGLHLDRWGGLAVEVEAEDHVVDVGVPVVAGVERRAAGAPVRRVGLRRVAVVVAAGDPPVGDDAGGVGGADVVLVQRGLVGVDAALAVLNDAGEKAWLLGEIADLDGENQVEIN